MSVLRKRLHYFLLSGSIFVIIFSSLFWLLNQASSAQPFVEGSGLPPGFDLHVTKSVTPVSGPPGTTVTYTIVISNNGPQVANDLIITDTLPPAVVVTHIDTGGGFVTETITPTLSWSYPTLDSGERAGITITGIISAALVNGPVLTNTAVISQSTNRPLPVLMAGAACPGDEVSIVGSNLKFFGNIHSNGDVEVLGTAAQSIIITGFVTYVDSVSIQNTYVFPATNNPSQVPPRNYPISYDYDDFMPNGYIYQAIMAANPSHYHFYNGLITMAVMQDQGWMVGSVIEEGVYVTPVGFNFNAADDLIGDDVTFVTLGEIDFNGGSSAFRPYFGGLLMITEGFSPAGQCDNNPVIQLTGSNINWGGIIYAPNGQISMNIAGGGSFYGSIIAGTIDVSVASLILIADQQYKSVESDFSNNTAEAIFTLILPYPTADAGGPYMVGEGSSIQLDASGSSGLNLSDYDWDFDSDGMYDDASGITVTFGNTADDAIYPIGLRVSNSYGFTDTAVTSVTVNNVAPTLANLTTTAPISESESVTLTGTIVDPGSQDTFTMTVDWADGEQDTLFYPTNTTNFTLSHQYLDDAPTPSDTYTITLTVNDKDGGSDSAELPVQVVNSPPAVDAGTGQEVLVHTPIYVSGTFTDLGPLDSHTISWDFGDGTVLTGSLTATHAFENAGLYTVTLTIVDDDGGFGSDSLIVVVTNYAVFMPVTPHQPLNETND